MKGSHHCIHSFLKVIEKTTLGQVAKYMKEVYSPESCYISIELDMEAIDHLKLNVDAHSVRRVLLYGIRGVTKNSTLRAIKEHQVLIKRGSTSKLRVLVPSEDDIKSKPYFALQMLKAALPDVIVQGIPSIQRAVINESEKGETPTYNLLMEGYGLQEVMGSPVSDMSRKLFSEYISSLTSYFHMTGNRWASNNYKSCA